MKSKKVSEGKANWGANKCDGLSSDGGCKVYCVDRVAKINSPNSAEACADFTPEGIFSATLEDGDCEKFLEKKQTGEGGAKQVAMMAYCQVKVWQSPPV